MLDLKALLLKLMQFLGSDVVIQHPLDMTYSAINPREPTKTTLNSILSATDDVMIGYNNLSTNLGISINARTTKVGRCLDGANAEWAWKVTDLTGISASTSEVVPISIYPLEAYDSFDAITSSWTSNTGWDWEFVELWAKFPKRTYTRKAGLQEEYCGYRTDTPSGTSTSVLFSSSYWEYDWPMRFTFFNGVTPPLAIAGLMNGTSNATTRIGFRPLSDSQYRFRLYSHISKDTSSTNSYDYYAFVYMFFTRHKPYKTIELTASKVSSGSGSAAEATLSTDPVKRVPQTMVVMYHRSSTSSAWGNGIYPAYDSNTGNYTASTTFAGETMFTNNPGWAGQTGYPESTYWYVTCTDTDDGTAVVPYDYFV